MDTSIEESIANNIIVSIILPAYNVEKYIADAIDSVLTQSYSLFELIVINDGSTDATELIASEIIKHDSRCRLIRTDNKGVSSARNVGIEASKGQYIYFMDADDLLERDALDTLVNLAQQYDADVVLVRARFVMTDGQSYPQSIPDIDNEAYKEYGPLACGYPSYIWNYFFRRNIISHHRFDPAIKVQEDTDFIVRVCIPSLTYIVAGRESYIYRSQRVGSALSKLSLQDCLSCKQVRGQVLEVCSPDAPGYIADSEYGAACFGVLRRASWNKELYYHEANIPQRLRRCLKLSRSIKTTVVLAANRFPRIFRLLFCILEFMYERLLLLKDIFANSSDVTMKTNGDMK